MTRLVWEQVTPATGSISVDGGRTVAMYSFSPERNHPYFWDLRPPNHDGIITNHAPWDHPWHHGLWWSWKFINDILYWEDREGYGGARDGLGRAHVVAHAVDQGDAGPVIREEIDWRDNATGTTVLREERVMSMHADFGGENAWAVDWDLSWTARVKANLSTTPYPEHGWGGYAGLNYRAARSMRDGEVILASGGRKGRTAVHSHRVEWMAYAGNVDGSGEGDPDHPASGGLAIFVDSRNWGAPTPVYAYSAEEAFGFLAVAPLMHAGKRLEPGEVLRLRYRTVVFGEQLNEHELDTLYQQYSKRHSSPSAGRRRRRSPTSPSSSTTSRSTANGGSAIR